MLHMFIYLRYIKYRAYHKPDSEAERTLTKEWFCRLQKTGAEILVVNQKVAPQTQASIPTKK